MLTDRYCNILIATIGIIVVICDALRDAWVNRAVEWWQWHTVKWIAFYSPFIIVTLMFTWKRNQSRIQEWELSHMSDCHSGKDK